MGDTLVTYEGLHVWHACRGGLKRVESSSALRAFKNLGRGVFWFRSRIC
jgi:hypothetical protein